LAVSFLTLSVTTLRAVWLAMDTPVHYTTCLHFPFWQPIREIAAEETHPCCYI
jgi:hypothetical protein